MRMSGFEHFQQSTADIERELVRKGVALGIDWDNEAQVRQLACQALGGAHAALDIAARHPTDRQALARAELFGLAELMLQLLESSAKTGFESHGGPVWRVFAKALWAARGTQA